MPSKESLDVLIARKAGEFAEQVRQSAKFADKEEEIRIAVERQRKLRGVIADHPCTELSVSRPSPRFEKVTHGESALNAACERAFKRCEARGPASGESDRDECPCRTTAGERQRRRQGAQSTRDRWAAPRTRNAV